MRWAELADLAVHASSTNSPAGWHLLATTRAAILFRVDGVLVKRVREVSFGQRVAPLSRVAIEASAPLYLGRWVPETLHVDPERGVFIRRLVVGETLHDARAEKIDTK